MLFVKSPQAKIITMTAFNQIFWYKSEEITTVLCGSRVRCGLENCHLMYPLMDSVAIYRQEVPYFETFVFFSDQFGISNPIKKVKFLKIDLRHPLASIFLKNKGFFYPIS